MCRVRGCARRTGVKAKASGVMQTTLSFVHLVRCDVSGGIRRGEHVPRSRVQRSCQSREDGGACGFRQLRRGSGAALQLSVFRINSAFQTAYATNDVCSASGTNRDGIAAINWALGQLGACVPHLKRHSKASSWAGLHKFPQRCFVGLTVLPTARPHACSVSAEPRENCPAEMSALARNRTNAPNVKFWCSCVASLHFECKILRNSGRGKLWTNNQINYLPQSSDGRGNALDSPAPDVYQSPAGGNQCAATSWLHWLSWRWR